MRRNISRAINRRITRRTILTHADFRGSYTSFGDTVMRSADEKVQSKFDEMSKKSEEARKEALNPNKPRRLHGVDCPVNAIADFSWSTSATGGRSRFPNAISDWYGTPLTVRERKMIALMGEITDKPDWNRKVLDDEIVKKWKAEMMVMNESVAPEKVLTEKAFNYCIEELRDHASKLEQTEMTPAIDADGIVYKSDTRVTPEMQEALKQTAIVLEDVPDDRKDWHPHSDEKVLDLVHPSLFPLLYGRSTVLPENEGTVSLADCDTYIGKGALAPVPEDKDVKVTRFGGLSSWSNHQEQHFYSKKYQWLPCEVAFREEGQTEITSYINNLHPRQHEPLYKVLQEVIAKVVPLWNGCLDRSDDQPPPRDDADADWIEPTEERTRGENEDSELDEEEIWELDEEWKNSHRTLVMPDLENGYQARADSLKPGLSSKPVDLRKDWAQEGLQVIVKLANIHLTPDKPEYEGGSWHIEGQLNEHICASALYYYDSSNITESYLSFRESTSVDHLSDKPYEQGDWTHIERVYDIEQDGAAVQNLGRVNTREGRLLAFPNVFQHRVEPFRLEDKSQPGHRKILALFLVDPHIRIPSTANVPPQQKDWWRGMLYGLDRVADLPPELAEEIVESAGDLPIDLEEAKKIRLELMEERKISVKSVDARFEQMDTFSFCEH